MQSDRREQRRNEPSLMLLNGTVLFFNVLLKLVNGYTFAGSHEITVSPQNIFPIELIYPLGKFFPEISTGNSLQVVNELAKFNLGCVLNQEMNMVCFTVELNQSSFPLLHQRSEDFFQSGQHWLSENLSAIFWGQH